MKKAILTVLIMQIFSPNFAQKKVESDFFAFTLPNNTKLITENPTNYTVKSEEGEQIYISGSLTTNLENCFTVAFEPDKTTEPKEIKTETHKFVKYCGKSESENQKKLNSELYIYKKENINIKILRINEFIDDQSFTKFLNSIKIFEQKSKSKIFSTKDFSIELPGEYKAEYSAKNSDFTIIEGINKGNDIFTVTIEKVNDFTYNFADKDFEYSFYDIIDGFLYYIRFENKNKYTLSNEFKNIFRQGFIPANYKPQANVFDIQLLTKDDEEITWFLENKSKSVEIFNGGKIKFSGNPVCNEMTSDELMFIGDDTGRLYQISILDNKISAEIQAHNSKINKIKRVSGYLATASDDGSIKLWNLVLSREPFKLFKEINSHSGAVTCIDSKNMVIISGSKDKSIIINYEYGLYDLMLTIHNDEITEIQIINDSCFVSTSKDKTLKFTDLNTLENFKTYTLKNSYVTCITPKNSGKYAGFGTSAGEIFIINKNTCEKIDIAKENKAIKLIRFFNFGILTVNIDNEVKYYILKNNDDEK